ncbi:amino acid transporter [Martensiomyces pterosporus]|nr:amino acid transporter [Martensiomyces pterosporus]
MANVYVPVDVAEPQSPLDDVSLSRPSSLADDVSPVKPAEVSDEGLRKEIGLFSASSIIIGQVIGSGIFSTPASVVFLCGTPSMALILWFVSGLFSLGGALASAELGTMFPQNGGMIRYLAHAYRRPRALIATIMAYSVTFFCRPAAIAANVAIFSQYFFFAAGKHDYIESRDYLLRGIGAAVMTLLMLLNMVSVRWSLRLLNVFAVVKMVTLLIVSFTGLLLLVGIVKRTPGTNWQRGFKGTKFDAQSFASAMTRLFWSWEGWSNVGYVVGEVKNVKRNLPLSLSLAMSSIAVLYMLANVAYFSVIPLEDIDNGTLLAAQFMDKVFGKAMGQVLLPICIGLSILGVVMSELFGGGRLMYAAGRTGFVPYGAVLGAIHPRFGTPIYAMAIIWALSLVFLFAPPPGEAFDLLVELVQEGMWYFYALTAFGAILLRRRLPNYPLRRFKSPLVLSFLFGALSFALGLLQFYPPAEIPGKAKPKVPYYLAPLLGVVFMALCVVPWYLRMWWYADRTGIQLLSWIDEEEQEVLRMTQDDVRRLGS